MSRGAAKSQGGWHWLMGIDSACKHKQLKIELSACEPVFFHLLNEKKNPRTKQTRQCHWSNNVKVCDTDLFIIPAASMVIITSHTSLSAPLIPPSNPCLHSPWDHWPQWQRHGPASAPRSVSCIDVTCLWQAPTLSRKLRICRTNEFQASFRELVVGRGLFELHNPGF